MSGQLSWPPAFPLCSLTLVLSAHWLVDLSSSRRPPGQTSPVSAQWNQTEREGGLLRFLSSLSPCTLTLIFLRLCLHKELGHSATSAVFDEAQDLQNSDPSLAYHIPLSFPPQGHCHILLPILSVICFLFFFFSHLGPKVQETVSVNKRKTLQSHVSHRDLAVCPCPSVHPLPHYGRISCLQAMWKKLC